jgi:hypothetical protein
VILLGRTLLLLLLCGPLAGCAWLGLGGDARAKARGPEILVQAGGRSHYFENRSPHCLAYTLPGEWEFATADATLRAAGGRYVGVTLYTNPSGGDGVAQTLAYIITETERDWDGPVPGSIEPFPAGRPGTLLLRFEEVTVTPSTAGRTVGSVTAAVGQKVRPPHHVITPFASGFTLVATVVDVEDARQVLDTLEVTEEPQCWRNVIRKRFPGVMS